MSVSMKRPVITKGRNKTHKFCPRCSELKPVTEFYGDISAYDGLTSRCKKCMQEYSLGTGGKQYYRLHKRPFPLDGRCEVCSIEFSKSDYHHWDDSNPSLGICVCGACDFLVEGLNEIERNPWKVDVYRKLKGEIEKVEETYVYLGSFSPPDGIYKLFLSNKQTHKWCPHCGRMLPVDEFNKKYSRYDGLQGWCKECGQGYVIINSSGKRFCGLHKRPKPTHCEFCDGKVNLSYHHWDDSNKSKGVWVCQTKKCHSLAEAVHLMDNGSLLPDKYSKLKQRIILEGVK